MKLSQKAIGELRNNKRARARIQLELDRTEWTVNKWINDNDDNSPLTTVAAMEIIREETGFTDSDILESAPTEA